MTDRAFQTAFEDTSLPRSAWTHQAHVRVAFLYLSQLPYREAEEKIIRGIQRYNVAKGNPTGYHHTITLAFARLIAARLTGSDWPTFLATNPDLMAFSCVKKHYSEATLSSDKARLAFVTPDREPLPEPVSPRQIAE